MRPSLSAADPQVLALAAFLAELSAAAEQATKQIAAQRKSGQTVFDIYAKVPSCAAQPS
jgi:hypothetical protein